MEREEIKDFIVCRLLQTLRPGMDELIDWMDANGYFNAPCSSQHHLCYEGGLAEHSFNVYKTMYDFMVTTGVEITVESVIITSFLHDLGKTGQYGKPNYIENFISDKKGGFKKSDKKPFVTNPELLSVPHEIRSIQIASQFIQLTEDESFAILYHNGLYGPLKYEIQGKETPLYMLLHFADMWASRVIEREEKESED